MRSPRARPRAAARLAVAARASAAAALAAIAAIAAAPGGARADDLLLRAEPDYSVSSTRTETADGVTTQYTQSVGQLYRLGLDRTFTPSLRLAAGGTLDLEDAEDEVNGVFSERDLRRTNAYGTLLLGDRVLGGALAYTRREDVAEGLGGESSTLAQTYTLTSRWRPEALPRVDLNLTRAIFEGRSGSERDLVTDQGLLALSYLPVPELDLRYALRVAHPVDEARGAESLSVLNTARATYSGRAWAERSTYFVSYDAAHRATRVMSAGRGDLETPRLPAGGLSLVQSPADLGVTPELSTLVPNPAVVDGATDVSANVNVGQAPAIAGDRLFRHVGVRFADVLTPVNALYLYVDRTLPPGVAILYQPTVWRSDDNVRWTEVPREGRGERPAVRFDPFLNRFELLFPELAARHVKVVLQPLPLGATTDPALSDVFVTELQPLLLEAPEEIESRASSFSNRASASLRTNLVRGRDLHHDASAEVAYASDRGRTTWFLDNTLTYRQPLGRSVTADARVGRSDFDQGRGHEGALRWAAGLVASPLPTLSSALTYSGSWIEAAELRVLQHAATLSARADLYDGIGVAGVAGYSVEHRTPGGETRTTSASASASLSPHRTTSLSATYGYNATESDQTAGTATSHRAEGTLSFSPVPALYLSGTAARVITDGASNDLATLAAGFTPFPGGALQLRVSYQESFDSATDGRTRIVSPGLRWNIRRGTYLDVNYTRLDAEAAAADTRQRSFFASLVLPVL